MKVGISFSVEHAKVEEMEKNVRAWGYKDRSEFLASAYEREKAEREKSAKKADKRPA